MCGERGKVRDLELAKSVERLWTVFFPERAVKFNNI
jgi:hypothetical protein